MTGQPSGNACVVRGMGFRKQLEQVLGTAKGERVIDEALRLARDTVAKQRLLALRRKAAGPAPGPSRATQPQD